MVEEDNKTVFDIKQRYLFQNLSMQQLLDESVWNSKKSYHFDNITFI